jgi:seryl-tRNA synthetase
LDPRKSRQAGRSAEEARRRAGKRPLDRTRRGAARAVIGKLQDAQERAQRRFQGDRRGNGRQGQADKAEALKAEVAEIKSFIQSGEATERDLTEAERHALSRVPNVPLDDVPVKVPTRTTMSKCA